MLTPWRVISSAEFSTVKIPPVTGCSTGGGNQLRVRAMRIFEFKHTNSDVVTKSPPKQFAAALKLIRTRASGGQIECSHLASTRCYTDWIQQELKSHNNSSSTYSKVTGSKFAPLPRATISVFAWKVLMYNVRDTWSSFVMLVIITVPEPVVDADEAV